MISLLIPSTTKNKIYADNICNNINDLYGNRLHEFEVLVSVDDDLTLSQHYNKLVSQANGDIVVLLHDDMVLHSNFLDVIKSHVKPKRILTYTRVEPPIYNDEYPGKIILDCGDNLASFDIKKFQQMTTTSELIEGGSQLFFACYKDDYIGLDETTYKLFCEDDDIHLRYKLLNYEKKVCSALVYHFVSKTSRADDYKKIEINSNRNFIRKWSFRRAIHNKKMNIIFIIKNCNLQLLNYFEPFAYKLYTDLPVNEINAYIQDEQLTTSFNLEDKMFSIDEKINTDNANAIIEFDLNTITSDAFNIIHLIPDILVETEDLGQYEIDCFKINVLSNIPKEVQWIL